MATHAVLPTPNEVDTTFVTRVRWYHIEGLTMDDTAVVADQGTFGRTGSTWRWVPSIAMDGVGNIAIGYSMSSKTVFPSMGVTGRLASDPPGVMLNSDYVVFGGSGSKNSPRWGDYFSMALDPVDDRTFW